MGHSLPRGSLGLFQGNSDLRVLSQKRKLIVTSGHFLKILFGCAGPYSQMALVVKDLPAKAGDLRDAGLIPGSGRFTWRREWLPTPIFLPEEFHGQRSLAGQATVHGVTRGSSPPSDWTRISHTGRKVLYPCTWEACRVHFS